VARAGASELAWHSPGFLFVGSLAAAFALAVIASRRQGKSVARALLDGIGDAIAWVVAFLP
jgi:hypothetical protein